MWSGAREAVRQVIFSLTYTQHGGSGLSWGPNDVYELEWDDVEAYLELLEETRKKEAAAIRSANRR